MVNQDKRRNNKNNKAVYDGKGGNQNGKDIKSRKKEIRKKKKQKKIFLLFL